MTDIFVLELPSDSTVPLMRGETPRQTPFVPTYLAPRSPDEQAALSLWINAHQVFFIALCAGTTGARRVTAALERYQFAGSPSARVAEFANACRWLTRLTDIRLATSAITEAAGAISPAIYASYIRPTMASLRADFSGVSSRDNWHFDDATHTMADAVHHLITDEPCNDGLRLAMSDYNESVKTWWACHARVMRRLVGEPISLARLAYDKQVAQQGLTQTYQEFQSVLRTNEALDCNDEFFAVRRHASDLATYRAAAQRTQAWLAPHIPMHDTPHLHFRRGIDAVLATVDEIRADVV